MGSCSLILRCPLDFPIPESKRETNQEKDLIFIGLINTSLFPFQGNLNQKGRLPGSQKRHSHRFGPDVRLVLPCPDSLMTYDSDLTFSVSILQSMLILVLVLLNFRFTPLSEVSPCFWSTSRVSVFVFPILFIVSNPFSPVYSHIPNKPLFISTRPWNLILRPFDSVCLCIRFSLRFTTRVSSSLLPFHLNL